MDYTKNLKKQSYMKKLLILTLCLFCLSSMAQTTVYSRLPQNRKELKSAQKWSRKGSWRNGFTKAKPHSSVNLMEFHEQYQKNQAQWDAAFRYLAEHDVTTMPKGKYPIEGPDLVGQIQDDVNQPLEKRNSESHYHHIDFQWVVRGCERFAHLDHNSSTPSTEWKEDVIRYNYDVSKTLFYDSTPGEFFLFFPCDWHIAKIATEREDQNIRVVVIKLDYVD